MDNNPESVDKTINLLVKDREKIVFEAAVASISSVNARGPFDVLPVHGNFISIIKQKLTIHKLDGRDQEFYLDNGVMRVRQNKVEVYLGVRK